MNGFSREAFQSWWNGFTCFDAHRYTAYHAWAAALEWYDRQRRLLDELVGSNDADQSEIQELW